MKVNYRVSLTEESWWLGWQQWISKWWKHKARLTWTCPPSKDRTVKENKLKEKKSCLFSTFTFNPPFMEWTFYVNAGTFSFPLLSLHMPSQAICSIYVYRWCFLFHILVFLNAFPVLFTPLHLVKRTNEITVHNWSVTSSFIPSLNEQHMGFIFYNQPVCNVPWECKSLNWVSVPCKLSLTLLFHITYATLKI